jgi:hypothetical protein
VKIGVSAEWKQLLAFEPKLAIATSSTRRPSLDARSRLASSNVAVSGRPGENARRHPKIVARASRSGELLCERRAMDGYARGTRAEQGCQNRILECVDQAEIRCLEENQRIEVGFGGFKSDLARRPLVEMEDIFQNVSKMLRI